jgi:cysteinyl-tRNA synthetase
MNDDFNSPLAISVLHEVVGEIFRNKNLKLLNTLYTLTRSLGLLKTTPESYFTWLPEKFRFSKQDIEGLIEKRLIKKKQKKYQEADEIRTQLSAEGIILEDVKSDSTLWRYDLSKT